MLHIALLMLLLQLAQLDQLLLQELLLLLELRCNRAAGVATAALRLRW